jgi:hypothetical protein
MFELITNDLITDPSKLRLHQPYKHLADSFFQQPDNRSTMKTYTCNIKASDCRSRCEQRTNWRSDQRQQDRHSRAKNPAIQRYFQHARTCISFFYQHPYDSYILHRDQTGKRNSLAWARCQSRFYKIPPKPHFHRCFAHFLLREKKLSNAASASSERNRSPNR